jgi:hypothetical protein
MLEISGTNFSGVQYNVLRGSGSHDWTVNNRFIPEERTFNLAAPTPYRKGPPYTLSNLLLYKLPAVGLGIARRDRRIHRSSLKQARSEEQQMLYRQAKRSEVLVTNPSALREFKVDRETF